MTSYCRRPANFAAHERPTIGDTKFSFTDFNHMGWLKCDGAWLNKSEYGLLFNVIGTTFGENPNKTQFRLPDPKGRVIGMVGSHVDSNSGTEFVRAKGEKDGAETHTLTIDQMPSHKHGPTDLNGNANGTGNTTRNGDHTHVADSAGLHSHTYVNQSNDQSIFPGAGESAADQADIDHTTGENGAHTHNIQNSGEHNHYMGSTGGSNYHNNMQPTLFYGNMYIYCGKVNNGSFPYTTDTDLY